jgi:hypothetical protein
MGDEVWEEVVRHETKRETSKVKHTEKINLRINYIMKFLQQPYSRQYSHSSAAFSFLVGIAIAALLVVTIVHQKARAFLSGVAGVFVMGRSGLVDRYEEHSAFVTQSSFHSSFGGNSID